MATELIFENIYESAESHAAAVVAGIACPVDILKIQPAARFSL